MKPFVVDVTENVVPGKPVTVAYRGTFAGKNYVPVPFDAMTGGFNANITMQSWLVFWRK